MPIDVGQRFVRRHNAARASTPNATAGDISYDTSVISEGGYSWSSPEVTVDTSGLYLYIGDLGQCDLASTRACGTLAPAINGVLQNPLGLATHRYLRNSGGAEGASIGYALLDLNNGDAVKVRNPGNGIGQLDAIGNYATRVNYGGGFQLIRFNDGNFTHLQRNNSDVDNGGVSNINTTRPWIDSSGTWEKLTWQTEVRDDDNLAADLNGDVILDANKIYLIVWGAALYSTDASRHTYVTALNIDGTRVQTGSGYQRNTASQCPPMTGMYIHVTGGTPETAFLEATQEIEGADAGNPQFRHGFFQVLELPATTEFIHADNGVADSLTTALAGTSTYYDTPLSEGVFDNSSNLEISGTDDIENTSGSTMPILAIGWHRWDRDSGTSGTRKMPWTRWRIQDSLNANTDLGYGIAGAYSRGQQSGDDTFQAHYCAAATMDLANNDAVKLQVNEPASGSNADMGIYGSANRYFLGVQVLDLSSLEVSGSGVDVPISAQSYSKTLNSVSISTGISVALSAISLGLGLNSQNVTASQNNTVSINVQTHTITQNGLDTSLGVGADLNQINYLEALNSLTTSTSGATNINLSKQGYSLSQPLVSTSTGLSFLTNPINYTLSQNSANTQIGLLVGVNTQNVSLGQNNLSVSTSGATLVGITTFGYSLVLNAVDSQIGTIVIIGGIVINQSLLPVNVESGTLIELTKQSYGLALNSFSTSISGGVDVEMGKIVYGYGIYELNTTSGNTVSIDFIPYSIDQNNTTTSLGQGVITTINEQGYLINQDAVEIFSGIQMMLEQIQNVLNILTAGTTTVTTVPETIHLVSSIIFELNIESSTKPVINMTSKINNEVELNGKITSIVDLESPLTYKLEFYE